MKAYGQVEVNFHALLFLALQSSAHRPLHADGHWTQGRSGRYGED